MSYRLFHKKVAEAYREARQDRYRNPELADRIEENICKIMELRREAQLHKSLQEKFADSVTNLAGSMPFFYMHIGWFGAWVVLNTAILKKPFDPYPFNFLTMVVSLEAIFLATLVMISQNRMQVMADERADLDLQINLIAEYEITRILCLVDAMAEAMGIEAAFDHDLDELKTPTAPDVVLKELRDRAKER